MAAAAGARDVSRLELLVCFIIIIIFYYTNVYFRSNMSKRRWRQLVTINETTLATTMDDDHDNFDCRVTSDGNGSFLIIISYCYWALTVL
jgi:hypothetical protein